MSVQLMAQSEVSALAAAPTPEEAAQIFLGAVSRGLASVVAEKLDEVLGQAVTATSGSTAIAGWNDHVKGGIINICWERPKLGLAAGQVVAFAPRTKNGVSELSANISIGISVSASF